MTRRYNLYDLARTANLGCSKLMMEQVMNDEGWFSRLMTRLGNQVEKWVKRVESWKCRDDAPGAAKVAMWLAKWAVLLSSLALLVAICFSAVVVILIGGFFVGAVMGRRPNVTDHQADDDDWLEEQTRMAEEDDDARRMAQQDTYWGKHS